MAKTFVVPAITVGTVVPAMIVRTAVPTRASPCRSGSKVTIEHFIPGAKVSAPASFVYDGCHYFNIGYQQLGQITRNWSFMGVAKDEGSTLPFPDLYINNFVYNCKDS